MKTFFIIMFTGLAFIANIAAAATDAEIVTETAKKCWEIPMDINYSRASATFEVNYNAEGELTRIVTVEYQPVRRAGEEFAISAQNAILQCANNTPVRSKTVRVVMRYTAPNTNGPLIMKRPMH
jgi:hypothetical protein